MICCSSDELFSAFGCSSRFGRAALRQPSRKFFHSLPPCGGGKRSLILPLVGEGKVPWHVSPLTCPNRERNTPASVFLLTCFPFNTTMPRCAISRAGSVSDGPSITYASGS